MKAKGNPVDLFGDERKVTPWTRAKGNPVDPKLHCYTIGKSPTDFAAGRARRRRDEEQPLSLSVAPRRLFSGWLGMVGRLGQGSATSGLYIRNASLNTLKLLDNSNRVAAMLRALAPFHKA
jgi:hypothetical protein